MSQSRWRAMPRLVPITGAALVCASMFAPVAAAADPVVVPFSFTSAEQSWIVPAGITSIHVDLVGGHGGSAGSGAVPGGFGGHVTGDLAVTAGEPLFIEVAGNGGNGGNAGPGGGGFNGGSPAASSTCLIGGGGGGGASDIRTINRGLPGSDASRLVIAGGGGGAANAQGSTGGGAGQPGGTPGNTGDAGPGGPGGAFGVGGGGAAGTDGSSGGAGTGSTGGFGGQGGSCIDTASTGGGGGGGGGLFGGGGGGGAGFTVFTGTHAPGGGGGGSSSLGSATNASAAGDNTGQPAITISYDPGTGGGGGADTGAVGAQVTVPSSAACLQLSTNAIDFGTLPPGSVNMPGTPDVTVTNCSGVTSDVFARGTDAADGAGAAWSLQDTTATCADTLGTDNYRLGLDRNGLETSLSTTNKLLTQLDSGVAADHTLRIYTACPGSTGSGSVMSMQITFLATTGG